MTAAPQGEFDLIRAFTRALPLAGEGVVLGPGDDAALLAPPRGEQLVATVDAVEEGVHFDRRFTPAEIGWKALAVNLSDLAAMGARPLAAFLSLGLPPALAVPGRARSWADRFYDGLLALADAHRTPLAGGDLAESPVALADIVLIGAVPRNRALLRSGARAGDALYVTGTLGGAAVGLQALAKLPPRSRNRLQIGEKRTAPFAAHLYPQPRIAQGLWLQRRRAAHSAIDISDGLSTDLMHLCEESRLSAEVDAALLPIAPGASLHHALHGGEDYELLFTAPAAARLPRSIAGVPVTRIGRMVRSRAGKPRILLLSDQGSQPLEPHGWQHFA